jgi:pyruvate formate lyase activating enzyme
MTERKEDNPKIIGQKAMFPVIGGLVPFTTIDYPGKISCVVFLQGCPWRCPYCSNAHLFEFGKPGPKDSENWEYVLNLLAKRVKMLDAVVFSGGEATAQADGLVAAIACVRAVSPHYKIGLNTNGCDPAKLARVLPHVDWIGLDIKALPEKYDALTGVEGSGAAAFDSLGLILESGMDFEARTTCDPAFVSKGDILALGKKLSALGVKNYRLQRYRPPRKDSPDNPPMREIMQFFTDRDFEAALDGMFPNFSMRY